MFHITHNCDDFHFLDKKQLVNLKTKTIRSGAWFKTLQRIDRVIFDLTMREVDNIRSEKLAKNLLMLARKLKDAIRTNFSNCFKEIVLPKTQKNSFNTKVWENISYYVWEFGSQVIIFPAGMHINMSKYSVINNGSEIDISQSYVFWAFKGFFLRFNQRLWQMLNSVIRSSRRKQ